MKRAGKTRCRGCQFGGAAKPESLAWRGAGEAVEEGVSNAVVDRVLGRDLSGSLGSGRMARGRMGDVPCGWKCVPWARRDGGKAEPGSRSGPTAGAAHDGWSGTSFIALRALTTSLPLWAVSPCTRSRVGSGTRSRSGLMCVCSVQRASQLGAAHVYVAPWLRRSGLCDLDIPKRHGDARVAHSVAH